VLWFVFDTTRADHLSLYGYPRPTSPHLDQVAREGVAFTRAYATAPWTLPSHASMLTGLYVHQHRADHGRFHLDTGIPMLSEFLLDAGYDTALFAGNPWLDAHSGLSRGFAHVVPAGRTPMIEKAFLAGLLRSRLSGGEADKGALESNTAFKAWLEHRAAGGRPFFVLVNYLEPHMPYHQVPAGDRERFLPAGTTLEEATSASNRFINLFSGRESGQPAAREKAIAQALYDGGIANIDRRFGEIIELLRRTGGLDDTLIIVTADHGELFGEHGIYGHDLGLYDPLIHVPLVMRLPGRVPAGARIDAPVQLVDLFPTVLELTGLRDRTPANAYGRSLWPVIAGVPQPDRPVFAEYTKPTLPWAVKAIRRMGFDPAVGTDRGLPVLHEMSICRQ
jgi:arylsulfatase A-like enzyme